MFELSQIINTAPFSMAHNEKHALYSEALSYLTQYHHEHCADYARLLDRLGFDTSVQHDMHDIPFFPVRLFKEYELASVPKEEIVKTMTSSGTTGQQVSKIFLDRETSANQTKILTKISGNFLGNKRLPMLIIDSRAVVKDRRLFSARGAGILGFSMLGYDTSYALDENMNLDFDAVEAFLEKHKGETIFLFGFTFMIWEHLYKKLHKTGRSLDFSHGIMLHGGGFKKLAAEAVDNETYKKRLYEVCGITNIYNYYGMVEQTGSIFMECEHGRLHASVFSDVIIRNPLDFSVCASGEQGLIQLVSLLPKSYPGHSILSEDIGEIIGEDGCPCGRLGKTFKIHGRIQNAEVRGCSDTYEKK
ncbi:MAG: acyl-protein synthetase [Christensenella sp.]